MKLLKTLEWDIECRPIMCDGKIIQHYQALKRSDNEAILHISKNSYHPTTNKRLVEIMQKLHNITGFAIEGYAELSGGKKVLGYLRSQTVMIAGNYTLENFLVLGNSHDGTQTTYIGLATIQHPSKNAFGRILKEKIPHTVNADSYLSEFDKKVIDFKQLELGLHQKLTHWQAIKLDANKLEMLTKKALGISSKTKIYAISTRKRNIFIHIQDCVDKQTKHYGPTLLGWFNGMTYYTTFERKSKEKVFGNITGATSYFNEIAFNVANKFAAEVT